MKKDFDKLALEDVIYGNRHNLEILLELLIEKGVITKQEYDAKLEEMVEVSDDLKDL